MESQKGHVSKVKRERKWETEGMLEKIRRRRMGSSNLKMAKEVKRFYPIRKRGHQLHQNKRSK